MPFPFRYSLISIALGSTLAIAQGSAPTPPPGSSLIERGIELAEKIRCGEALPLLNEGIAAVNDKRLKYRALIAVTRCGIHERDGKLAVDALMALRHDFPADPEVLYLTTHIFLEIAVDASRELASVAPDSYQVGELEAETLESQGKWEGAATIYKKILAQNPKLPEIHFRLGRALLSQPETPETKEEARKAFEQELAIDPTSASAEFWLGELERRDGKAAEAIPHFNSALKLDPTLAEAMLALGMAYNSQAQFSEAITPLENYTKTAPGDPAGHYQLALAYARTGRKEDSARELAIQQRLAARKQTQHASPDETH